MGTEFLQVILIGKVSVNHETLDDLTTILDFVSTDFLRSKVIFTLLLKKSLNFKYI